MRPGGGVMSTTAAPAETIVTASRIPAVSGRTPVGTRAVRLEPGCQAAELAVFGFVQDAVVVVVDLLEEPFGQTRIGTDRLGISDNAVAVAVDVLEALAGLGGRGHGRESERNDREGGGGLEHG